MKRRSSSPFTTDSPSPKRARIVSQRYKKDDPRLPLLGFLKKTTDKVVTACSEQQKRSFFGEFIMQCKDVFISHIIRELYSSGSLTAIKDTLNLLTCSKFLMNYFNKILPPPVSIERIYHPLVLRSSRLLNIMSSSSNIDKLRVIYQQRVKDLVKRYKITSLISPIKVGGGYCRRSSLPPIGSIFFIDQSNECRVSLLLEMMPSLFTISREFDELVIASEKTSIDDLVFTHGYYNKGKEIMFTQLIHKIRKEVPVFTLCNNTDSTFVNVTHLSKHELYALYLHYHDCNKERINT